MQQELHLPFSYHATFLMNIHFDRKCFDPAFSRQNNEHLLILISNAITLFILFYEKHKEHNMQAYKDLIKEEKAGQLSNLY